jgi:NADH-quinone oxidoreductase subunit L
MNAGGLHAGLSVRLDTLSLVFMFVITFVGFLILVYSTEFMKDEEGYGRFFAYMNLFIASMLILVLADNLILLYLGWEGVGLCSYLLIGFWYKDPANGYAARKAFITTRVGDTAMLIGLFLLYSEFHTLNISDILAAAPGQWEAGAPVATLAAFLLLGGAVGKSAQLPLQTWLPDAMAGPSPVSALIHAATMVTAGVYLVARTHTLFELAPMAQYAVAIIGAATLLLAGLSALTQHDIKRVLAYSTISQIGYMFLALGAGAWSAAVFHFMIHGFFKALLFLGAGAIIITVHHEHNMFKMGGLYKKLPVVFWTFLIAASSLAALPLVTAGFYSKDKILWEVFVNPSGGTILWLAGYLGAFITVLYTFRMVFVTFFGETKTEPTFKPGMRITIPLVILAFFSFAGGFIELPHTMGGLSMFSNVLHHTLPHQEIHDSGSTELMLQILTSVTAFIGLAVAYFLYLRRKELPARIKHSAVGTVLHRFWHAGWGFDAIYDTLLVRPIVTVSRINRNDIIDLVSVLPSKLMVIFNKILVYTQNGKLRWYLAAITFGAIVILAIAITT